MDMLRKLPIIYIVALAVHEIEELKFPGGFVELVTVMTGLKLKKLGLAQFGLLMFTLFATIIPTFISGHVWTVMATLFIGIIEIFAHLAAGRVNPKKFYSPGMLTAIVVQLPVAVYGFYYLFSIQMFAPMMKDVLKNLEVVVISSEDMDSDVYTSKNAGLADELFFKLFSVVINGGGK